MIGFHKCAKIRTAQIMGGIVKDKGVDAQLIGHGNIDIIRDPACHPVMTADRFHPPDLIVIAESDAVHLIGAICFQQMTKTQDAFPCAMNIRKHQADKVFLPKPARLAALCIIDHQGICAEHPRIGSDRLRGAHADICGIDAAGAPYAFSFHRIRHSRIAHGVIRKIDRQMRDDRSICPRLFIGMDDHKLFRGKAAGAGIIIACDHA